MTHHIKPNPSTITIDVTPESAGWKYLGFRVVSLKNRENYSESTGRNEVALVPLSGSGRVTACPDGGGVGGQTLELARESVFIQMPQVLYVPPGHEIQVETENGFEFATGSAPAQGRYPLRLFQPHEMKQEVRGGGAATRQVNHILNHPLPAERLILFEVYVPGGMWSGYPPHCHDGYMGSSHLEETYYYRISPDTGFAIHRNYRRDNDFDELFTVKNGDLVLVTQGFHPVAAPPGSNIYFLNYLAGDLLEEARGTPPFDDPDWGWIKEDWGGRAMELPLVEG